MFFKRGGRVKQSNVTANNKRGSVRGEEEMEGKETAKQG